MPGSDTSVPEVTGISSDALHLLVDGRELTLPFEHFPWFEGAPAEAVRNVERPHPSYLRWPVLDVDLSLRSIEHPEDYPLKARIPG